MENITTTIERAIEYELKSRSMIAPYNDLTNTVQFYADRLVEQFVKQFFDAERNKRMKEEK